MNELIKITEQNGKKAVSARDLHEFLEVRSRFNDWIANRIEKYDLVVNLGYITLIENLVSGGQRKEIVLSVDAAKEQVKHGYDEFLKTVKTAIKQDDLIRNNVLSVPIEQQSKDIDLRARCSMLKQMLLRVKG